LNPGRRGGKPATNRFSYGAAKDVLSEGCYYSTEDYLNDEFTDIGYW
jgi:hypothetical protein